LEVREMKKIEKVYDKYGFYIGDRITTTRIVRRKAKAPRKTYTEAEHSESTLQLVKTLETACEQARETGGDICISRSGVSVAPYKPDRKVFY
jgi:hypothetical protein